ncbi:unnamed protein product [Bemisia tabaci]|uniref:Uncharacterized protein n=1 Tax=Bemisia tabaci TaxID=7038 RepID=A0A9P0AKP4_BEMTA|nr:unnamed protein product [Bemisia tabaci]
MCLPTKSDVRAVVDAFKSSLDAETIKKLSIGGKFVVDDNVYTKNQQFRLLYNSKMLHSTSLHPVLPLEKAFKLTEENIHTTICQVLKESEKFHPLIKPEGTVTKHIPENNKLRKFPVEDVLPPAVIERITHLTGAVFSKEDIKALAQELKVSLGTVVRVVNKSCQSGAHYLDESDIHVAAVAALTATKAMTNKNLRMSIIRKTLRQFQTAGKHFNHDTFKIYSQRSSGGLPEDMLPEKLVEDYEAYREVASKEARALRENARKLKEEEEAKKAEAEKAKTQAAAEEQARELALKLSDKNIGGESSNAPVTPDTQESQKPPAKPRAKIEDGSRGLGENKNVGSKQRFMKVRTGSVNSDVGLGLSDTPKVDLPQRCKSFERLGEELKGNTKVKKLKLKMGEEIIRQERVLEKEGRVEKVLGETINRSMGDLDTEIDMLDKTLIEFKLEDDVSLDEELLLMGSTERMESITVVGKCANCNTNIMECDKVIRCDGPECEQGGFHHLQCAGMTEPELNTLNKFESKLWLCNKCAGDINTMMSDLVLINEDFKAENAKLKRELLNVQSEVREWERKFEQANKKEKSIENSDEVANSEKRRKTIWVMADEFTKNVGSKLHSGVFRYGLNVIVECNVEARMKDWGRYWLDKRGLMREGDIVIFAAGDYNSDVVFKPSATFAGVIENLHEIVQGLTPNDYLVIMGGSNDIFRGETAQQTETVVTWNTDLQGELKRTKDYTLEDSRRLERRVYTRLYRNLFRRLMRRLYDTLFGALRNAIGLYLGLPPVPLDNVPEDDSSDEEIVEIDSDRHARARNAASSIVKPVSKNYLDCNIELAAAPAFVSNTFYHIIRAKDETEQHFYEELMYLQKCVAPIPGISLSIAPTQHETLHQH